MDYQLLEQKLNEAFPPNKELATGEKRFFKVKNNEVHCYFQDVYCDKETKVIIEDNDTIESIIKKFEDGKAKTVDYREWSLD